MADLFIFTISDMLLLVIKPDQAGHAYVSRMRILEK